MVPILIALIVCGFLVLLGMGLIVGGVVAATKPSKVVPGSNPEQRVIDTPVVVGLLMGGAFSIILAYIVWRAMTKITPVGRASGLMHAVSRHRRR